MASLAFNACAFLDFDNKRVREDFYGDAETQRADWRLKTAGQHMMRLGDRNADEKELPSLNIVSTV